MSAWRKPASQVIATHCLVVNLQQYEHGQIKLYFYACQLKNPDSDDYPHRSRGTVPMGLARRTRLAGVSRRQPARAATAAWVGSSR